MASTFKPLGEESLAAPAEGSIRVWRLVKTRWASSAFDGEGAYRYGGRWNSRGRRVVYSSATLSLALLESLVHLDPAARVPRLAAIYADLPKHLLQSPAVDPLRDIESPSRAREIGDDWIGSAGSAALRVPSRIVPIEQNYLLNPLHPDFSKISIGPALAFDFDPRFMRPGA